MIMHPLKMTAISRPGWCRGSFRNGFTATELLVVIAIMVLMVGLAVPSVSESYQRTRVGNAANAIQEAHRQARQLARQEGLPDPAHVPTGQAHFGVRVTSTYAEVTYGGPRWGRAYFPFPKGVIAVSNGAAVGTIEWIYQYGTGYPTDLPSYATPGQVSQAINIGVSGSSVRDLRVRTVDGTADGRHSAAVRIFRTGPCHVELQ